MPAWGDLECIEKAQNPPAVTTALGNIISAARVLLNSSDIRTQMDAYKPTQIAYTETVVPTVFSEAMSRVGFERHYENTQDFFTDFADECSLIPNATKFYQCPEPTDNRNLPRMTFCGTLTGKDPSPELSFIDNVHFQTR